jgi:hypothetical protein
MATTSNGFLFSGRAEVVMQHVVVCLELVRLRGEPPYPPPETEGSLDHVEYWKAECGETRPLRLERGKGREVLPIVIILRGKSECLGETLKQCTRDFHHIVLCRRHERKCDGPKLLAHERQRISKRGKSLDIPGSLTNG